MTENIILALIIGLSVFSIPVAAQQEESKTIEFDEYGDKINCEELMARLDSFFVEISRNPSMTGYVIIGGVGNDVRKNLIHESLISGYAGFRGIGTERLKIARGALSTDFRVQLWLVTAKAEKPFVEDSWSNLIAPTEKPFLFFSEYPFDDLCPPSDRKVFADVLLANPASRGNIVIRTTSTRKGLQIKKELLNQMKGFQVPGRRLRVYNVKPDSGIVGDDQAEVEFWFLP